MTSKFTIVNSEEKEREISNLYIDRADLPKYLNEKEVRKLDYQQVAKWVHYSCDDPIGEIAWLIQALFERNEDGSRFSATFKDVYGDVLELEEEDDRY